VALMGISTWGGAQDGGQVVQKDSQDPTKVLQDYELAKNDKAESRRVEAVRALLPYKGDRRVQERLAKVVREGRGDAEKMEAAQALSQLVITRDRLMTLDLAQGLAASGKNPQLQIAICAALGAVGDGAAVNQLAPLFRSRDAKLAVAAIRAATSIRELPFFDPLLNLLRELELDPASRRDVRDGIRAALSSISGHNGSGAADWVAWRNKQQDESIKKLLDTFTADLRAAKDDNERASAIYNLGQAGVRDPRIIEKVRPFMTSGSELVRAEAVDVVAAHTGVKDLSRILVSVLEPNRNSQKVVERLLSALGRAYPDPLIEPILIQYMERKKDDVSIVSICCRSLGAVGGARSLEVLFQHYDALEKDREKMAKAQKDEKRKLEQRVATMEPILKESLVRLTGQNLKSVVDYHKWWVENRGKYKFPADLRREREREREVAEKAKAVELSKRASVPHLGDGAGLAGQYYAGKDFKDLKMTRVDEYVDFEWGDEAPDAAVPKDDFCVRWSGQLLIQYSETYTFYTQADDGARLWVNDKLVIDDWQSHGIEERSGTIALTAGQKVNIRLEYFDNVGMAFVRLLWSSPSVPKAIVPRSQMFPAVVESPPPPVAVQKSDPPAPVPPAPGEPKEPVTKPVSAAPVATNVAQNGDFDDGNLSGWTPLGGFVTVVGSQRQGGRYAAQLVGSNGMSLSQPLAGKCAAGKNYTVTAWVKIIATGASSGVPRLRVSRKGDLSDPDFAEATARYDLVNEWQELRVTCTFTEDDLKQGVFAGIRHFGFHGTDYVDDVVVSAP
jgi:hypothetical protein